MKKIYSFFLAILFPMAVVAEMTVIYPADGGVDIMTANGGVSPDWTIVDGGTQSTSGSYGAYNIWSYPAYDTYFGFTNDAGAYPRGLFYYKNGSPEISDWAISPAITLQAGKKYYVKIAVRTPGVSKVDDYYASLYAYLLESTENPSTEALQVLNAMTDANEDEVIISADGKGFVALGTAETSYWLTISGSEFTVPETKEYHIGIYTDAMGKYASYMRITNFQVIGEADSGIVSGINAVSIDNTNNGSVIYDLNGRRVTNPTTGFYIVDGKKVFINK